MRISDWSSDVCSSGLGGVGQSRRIDAAVADHPRPVGGAGRAVRETAARRYADRDPRGAGGAEPGLFRLSALIVQPVQAAAHRAARRAGAQSPAPGPRPRLSPKSEEHTSELQSLMRISYAVFCLKKKKYYILKQH